MTLEEPKAKRRNISRGISRNTETQRHPLNVKPGGNALIFSDSILRSKRKSLLGDFHRFDDELILEILGYLNDPKDLLRVSHSSRIFYAFLYDEELWRKLYISKALKEEAKLGSNAPIPPLGIKHWLGSWRRTLLQVPKTKEANIQLEDNLLCSDTLFRPFQCSQIDYNVLFKDLIEEEEMSYKCKQTQNKKFGIERFEEGLMTDDLFNAEYHDTPFILTNNDENRWPSWNLNGLKKRFPDVQFRQESVQWPLDFYSQYFAENNDESPLYLFDCQSKAMKQLVKEYTVPKIFQNDLFEVFNNQDCRPDFRWIIVGPERSGSTFHKDPNATSAWNANLTGRKLWVMLSPKIAPPGVGTDDDESEVTSPVGIAEWVLSGFYNDSVKLALQGHCLIGVTFPGECIYVPSGWWHTVINLEDSVALTQNFVPKQTLGKVLYFLKNKRDQISGFHLNVLKKSLESWLKDHNGNGDYDLSVFHNWLNKVEESELNDEDIGVCGASDELPIYEYFVALLKQREEYRELLENGFESMREIEREMEKSRPKAVAQSKQWEKLVNADQSAFSFNFDNDDE